MQSAEQSTAGKALICIIHRAAMESENEKLYVILTALYDLWGCVSGVVS